MTRGSLISIGVLAFALGCNSPRVQRNNDVPRATSAESVADPAPSGREGGSNAASAQLVTLIGCLQGPPLRTVRSSTAAPNGMVGTQEPAASARTPSERFILADARAASPESAGVGANGAGASGGPLVNGKSSFELDGIPAPARAYVNKAVSVTGRLDANPGLARSTTAPGADGSTAGSAGETASTTGDSAEQPVDTRRLRVETVQLAAETCPDR
jgi:hypothetical protein